MLPSRPPIFDELVRLRRFGRTTTSLLPNGRLSDPRAIADFIARSHGFVAIGTEWRAIDAADAPDLLASVLHRDLAHGGEIMSWTTAAELARQFMDLVPTAMTYFTNLESSNAVSEHGIACGWMPLSTSTFDAALVCVGSDAAAFVCVEDED